MEHGSVQAVALSQSKLGKKNNKNPIKICRVSETQTVL